MKTAPLLLTGFEPFGGDAFNPSAAVVKRLHGTSLANGISIHSLTLPVSGPAAWKKLSGAIRKVQPAWIVATGVSGRAELSIETTGWNEDDFRIPDNAGLQPRNSRILTRGPDKTESPLALRLLNEREITSHSTSQSDLPIRPSTDPGRFVCNHLYYRLLHLTRRPGHSAHQRAVFLHLPCSPEMQRGPDDARFFYPVPELTQVVRTVLCAAAAAGGRRKAAVNGQ